MGAAGPERVSFMARPAGPPPLAPPSFGVEPRHGVGAGGDAGAVAAAWRPFRCASAAFRPVPTATGSPSGFSQACQANRFRPRPDTQPAYPTFVLKYSIVFTSPSSSCTFGSQPSSVRARVMSGWRTFGSSVGSGR